MSEGNRAIRIGGVPEHFNLPWHLAIESGAIAELGFDAHWIDYPGGTGAMLNALDEGSVDIALVLTEGAVTAIGNGNGSRIHSVWVESPLAWGIHVGADSPFESVADLEGQRFAISRYGSGSELMAYVLADERGWDLTERSFVVVGGLTGALEALPDGTAEIFLWERFTTQPYVDDGRFRRVGVVPTPWPCFVVATRPGLDLQKSDIDGLVSTALHRASDLIAQDDAAATFAERYGLAPGEVAEWLTTVSWPAEPSVTTDMLDAVVDRMVALGRLNTAVPSSDLLI